jgi:hypothetical protein
MRIGLRSHNGAEERLLFTQQIGAQGASIWASACEGYMVANLRALKEFGYQGYLVPDHHFGVAADDPEYPLISRAWQVGYIHGLLQALGD